MKHTFSILKLLMLSLTLWAALAACHDDEDHTVPVITIDEAFERVENLNVGDEVRIHVNVRSAIGVRRLAYYFTTRTANGTTTGKPFYVDPIDFPKEVDEEIVFTVPADLASLTIISFDKNNNNAEVHVTPANIRSIPTVSFQDNIKYRETVFENKLLKVAGTITSEHSLASVTYQTLVNGVASEENAIVITDAKQMPFHIEVATPRHLTGIVIKARNAYAGIAVDTFKIGTVEEDGVNIVLAEGKTEVPLVYADINNTLQGTVFSGSAVTSLTYAIKRDGVYGTETPVTIGDPADDFGFTVDYVPAQGTEAIRFTGRNVGNKTAVAEFAVGKVYTRLVHFADIRLTSAVGAGRTNWFAAYQAPHVFDVAQAAGNQLMVDFALVKYSASSFRIMPAAVFDAGAAYKTAMAPYMMGFTKAPYTLITTNRAALTQEAFDGLVWDGQMMEFLDAKVKAPVAGGGENYNFYGTNRRFNDALKPGSGFIIGWGQWSPIQNQAFGIVMVKEYAVTDGEATVTLEIKVPANDNRTKYNPVSLFDYAP